VGERMNLKKIFLPVLLLINFAVQGIFWLSVGFFVGFFYIFSFMWLDQLIKWCKR
jgi:hypothetical protein